MNEGVKILLARMETHPEEFVGNGVYSKWNEMFMNCIDYLDPEDVEAYKSARNALIQQHFTETVMKALLAPEEDMSMGKPFYPQPNAMPLVGQTQGQSWANTQLQKAQAAQNSQLHELLHQKALKNLQTTPAKKPHKTLFGKLFNYS